MSVTRFCAVTLYSLAFLNAIYVITCLKHSFDHRRQFLRRKPIERVLNGVAADRKEYAYVVALELFGLYIPEVNFTQYRLCTGSLISKNFVISAAHCANADRIRYGDLSVPSTSPKASHSNITKIFIYNNYKPSFIPITLNLNLGPKNDIGLYKVEPVNLQKYAQLSAIDYKTLIGLPVHFVGLGLLRIPPTDSLKSLSKIATETETSERQIIFGTVKPCGKTPRTGSIHPMICLAWKCWSKEGIYKGDSGGPLFYDGKIVGIMVALLSWDSTLLFDSVSTPVSVYLDWLRQVIDTENLFIYAYIFLVLKHLVLLGLIKVAFGIGRRTRYAGRTTDMCKKN